MLYWLAPYLTSVWGPFRLLSSHLMLLAAATLLGGLVVWSRLPRLWRWLPLDGGKQFVPQGMRSAGKPTGAGWWIALLLLPVILLLVPLGWWEFGVLGALYLSMLCGYLDDCSRMPWGNLKKGLLDALVSALAAYCIYRCHGSQIWLPFTKTTFTVPLALYLPGATTLLWFAINATNCSDGVDGLAGTLTLFSLFAMAAFLYGVVGYRPLADYLLIPHNADGARWAILVGALAGALAGYLWHNAEPSRVLMGDAGSRMFGMLVGVAVLVSGNPVLIFVVAPVVLVNGGTGLFKIGLLRILKRCGLEVRQSVPPELAAQQKVWIRALHKIRFPLHDQCRKNMQWSNAQVLMRFVLVQAFLTPILFVLIIKIR